MAEVNNAGFKARWLNHAKRPKNVGIELFSARPVQITADGAVEIRILG